MVVLRARQGRVAQLVRAVGLYPSGPGFNPQHAHKNKTPPRHGHRCDVLVRWLLGQADQSNGNVLGSCGHNGNAEVSVPPIHLLAGLVQTFSIVWGTSAGVDPRGRSFERGRFDGQLMVVAVLQCGNVCSAHHICGKLRIPAQGQVLFVASVSCILHSHFGRGLSSPWNVCADDHLPLISRCLHADGRVRIWYVDISHYCVEDARVDQHRNKDSLKEHGRSFVPCGLNNRSLVRSIANTSHIPSCLTKIVNN